MMESLSDSLNRRLSKKGMDGLVTAASLLETAKRVVPESATPKSLRDGLMWIEITTPVEAYFFKQEIENHTDAINAAIGQPIVKEIRIRVLHKAK